MLQVFISRKFSNFNVFRVKSGREVKTENLLGYKLVRTRLETNFEQNASSLIASAVRTSLENFHFLGTDFVILGLLFEAYLRAFEARIL